MDFFTTNPVSVFASPTMLGWRTEALSFLSVPSSPTSLNGRFAMRHRDVTLLAAPPLNPVPQCFARTSASAPGSAFHQPPARRTAERPTGVCTIPFRSKTQASHARVPSREFGTAFLQVNYISDHNCTLFCLLIRQ